MRENLLIISPVEDKKTEAIMVLLRVIIKTNATIKKKKLNNTESVKGALICTVVNALHHLAI